MSEQKIATAWIWIDEFGGGTMGATINKHDNTIDWFDKIGCACNNGTGQTFANYLERGAPAGIDTFPADVKEELERAIEILQSW